MKGMFTEVNKLRKELASWLRQQKVESACSPFLRYYVIDMAGEMDIEIGVPVMPLLPGGGRVTAGALPAGRYASLIYVGNGLTGNKALLDWAKAKGLTWDRWQEAKGDAFRCRCETFLTDPKLEPHKTKWEIEVAIKLADEAPKSNPSVHSTLSALDSRA
jgi:hypothetical protein